GHDRAAEHVFRELARVTRGAYCRFDPGAARQLAELLRAAAVYAAGGIAELGARRDAGAVKLLSQMKLGGGGPAPRLPFATTHDLLLPLVLFGLRACHQVRSACSRGLSMD